MVVHWTLDLKGPGMVAQRNKIKCMGISTTVPCFVEDFFRTVIVFPILFNPPSADLSIIVCKKTLLNMYTGNGCRNSHLILSFFLQLGSGPCHCVVSLRRLTL